MKKIRKFISFTVAAFLAMEVWATPAAVKDLVNSKYYDELMSKGVVSLIHDDGSINLELLPETSYSSNVKANMIQKNPKNYPFTYESLYYMSKKDLLKASNSSASDVTLNDISRVCRSVSKMEGMTYYSSTRKKQQVLYSRAYMIDGPDGGKIADQNTGNANGQVSYCMQDDASFGECRYKLNYSQSDKEMLAVFSNLDVIGLGPFKAIYPELMKINILVVDGGDDILFYICCDVDSVKFPGIKGQITDSMTTRMDAVYNWFLKQF